MVVTIFAKESLGGTICDDSASVVLHAWSHDILGQDLKVQSL